MSKEEQTCPHHEEIERRLKEGNEEFKQLLDALQENNLKLERLLTDHQTTANDVANLKTEIYGEKGGNGLKNKFQKIQTGLLIGFALCGSGGGIWAFLQFLATIGN